MRKPKGVRLGNPINNFDEIWQGIVSSKLEGASRQALMEALKMALVGFAKFRTLDLELKRISGELSAKDLNALGEVYITWLIDIEKAFDHVFHRTPTEPAMSIYRRPLEDLRLLLLNLIGGDLGAFRALKARAMRCRTRCGSRGRLFTTHSFSEIAGASLLLEA